MKNKSYTWVGIAFIVLVFGIWAVPKIIERLKGNELMAIGKAPSFSLTDQNGQTVTNDTYKGKVYVLEFFFTSCPSICPKMNSNMVKIQHEFDIDPNFGIASISIDPQHDTPAVLKKHAAFLGVTSRNWHMLTGDRDYIYNLSNKGFNLYAGFNPKISGGFEHSGLFALIDKKGNIRCRRDQYGNPIVYYDGIAPSGIAMIEQDIKTLLHE
jgi:protein SCO1/2